MPFRISHKSIPWCSVVWWLLQKVSYTFGKIFCLNMIQHILPHDLHIFEECITLQSPKIVFANHFLSRKIVWNVSKNPTLSYKSPTLAFFQKNLQRFRVVKSGPLIAFTWSWIGPFLERENANGEILWRDFVNEGSLVNVKTHFLCMGIHESMIIRHFKLS